MINLKQIQALEKKINNAVELISLLKRENKALKKAVESSRNRVEDLESLVNEFKSEQFEIEKGILNALNKLDELEDDITDATDASDQSSETTLGENKTVESELEQESEHPELEKEKEKLNTPVEESFELNNENRNRDNENKDEDLTEDHNEKKEKDDASVSPEDGDVNELDIF